MKRVWMCWSILPAFRFPKFSVCVVFVNNMLACCLYRWTTLLNLDEQLCWIFGPPRSCAGARKSLVFKVEENNMSMNMLVTVMMLQMLGENIIKCFNIWKIWHIGSSRSALLQILQSWMYIMTWGSSTCRLIKCPMSHVCMKGKNEIYYCTRSLGALRAPTSSWRPFGPALGPSGLLDFVLRALRALRPVRWARLRSGPVKIGHFFKGPFLWK